MSKIKYLTQRILKMNFRNLFKVTKEIHETTGKSSIILFFDIVHCGLKYQAGYKDYQLFEMYNMNSKQRKTVVTRGINNQIIKTYNNKEYIKYFSNKCLFNEKFNKYLNRDWLEITGDNFEEFEKFLKNKKEIIIKPIDGQCGQKVEKIQTKDYTPKKLYKYICDNKIGLVEEVVYQCKEINDLHPSSINTIRAVTLKGKLVVAYLRIGNYGNVVDNINHDGMSAPIDIEDGIIKFPAIDKKFKIFNNHPMTNTPIVGLKIPKWNQVKKLLKEVSTIIPEVGYVGWDVCVGKDKLYLIEGNDFPGNDIYQLPPHRQTNEGIYPLFQKIMEDKNENSNSN